MLLKITLHLCDVAQLAPPVNMIKQNGNLKICILYALNATSIKNSNHKTKTWMKRNNLAWHSTQVVFYKSMPWQQNFFFISFLKIQLKNVKNQIAKVSMYSDVKIDKQAVKAGTLAVSVIINKFKLLPISKNPLRWSIFVLTFFC